MNPWGQWTELPKGRPMDGSVSETSVGSMELIEEHSNDDKEGSTSMGFTPNGCLSIMKTVR